ncbi:hypothetical protein AVEN_154445-1 [Araneus ventricosus]|uniref:Uncharacterized protein n=1 Tax=Araneus ventricosus TaxID=182803 RepID=A0A4Y2JWU1_ARAVE|nr:hypothetical protein AVEN_154445-1 [Araneus ventricosus]
MPNRHKNFPNRPDELHERRNNTPHPTGNGECIKQEFYGFLQGIKVMYDALKSIPNLLKSVSELTQLSTTEDRINYVIKALSSVANAKLESRQKDKTEELETLNPENGTLWTKAKILRRKDQKIPALKGELKLALSDPDKAETIALSLEKQFSLNNLSHSETEEEVNESTNNFSPPINNNHQNDNINGIQPSEVIKIIKKLNIKKTCGRDGITNKMIKNIPSTMVFAFTEIINNIFNFNYFPNAWKTAVVVPVLKPRKDPTFPENYRPISLLSTLSKITENFILDKLNEHLIGNRILCPEQFGFRKSLTTNHQLLRVVEYITKGFDRDTKLEILPRYTKSLRQGLEARLDP